MNNMAIIIENAKRNLLMDFVTDHSQIGCASCVHQFASVLLSGRCLEQYYNWVQIQECSHQIFLTVYIGYIT